MTVVLVARTVKETGNSGGHRVEVAKKRKKKKNGFDGNGSIVVT